jgi:hypothetical protein
MAASPSPPPSSKTYCKSSIFNLYSKPRCGTLRCQDITSVVWGSAALGEHVSPICSRNSLPDAATVVLLAAANVLGCRAKPPVSSLTLW